MPAKSSLTVLLEPVFVRDHQRRLRLVMDLLEQELRQQHTPPEQYNQQTTKTEVQTDEDRGHLRAGVQRAATAK
ncbi:MAG: hypothetical protein M3R15_11600 [Acidobacteriota bacterium]|nr:hypothetical protein [Acidobacteriota bacterium]